MHQELTHPAIIHMERTGYTCEYERPKTCCKCRKCGWNITVGEDYLDVNGDIVCTECAYDYMAQYKKVAE